MKEKARDCRNALAGLPTSIKLIVSVALLPSAVSLGLLLIIIAFDAARLSEIMTVLPSLPLLGSELLEYFRIGQQQTSYMYWLIVFLQFGAVMSGVVLLALWWPRL